MEGLKDVGGMVLVQVVRAGENFFDKLALDGDGMNARILMAYRYFLATIFLAPATVLERNSRPKMTWKVLMLAFLCVFFGGTLSQNLYLACIRVTSSTFASTMTNLIPVVTFILTIIFRMENLAIRILSGRLKIVGTLVGIGGVMLLNFYKGVQIHLWSTHIDLVKSHHYAIRAQPYQNSGNRNMSLLFGFGSCLCSAISLIFQAKLNKEYPCNYTSSALMCFMGMIQALFYAICVERNLASWETRFDIRLLTVVYAGLALALVITLMNWCIKRKGPVFPSAFNPLMVVVVAFLNSILLDEKLYLGSILGALLTIIGSLAIVWGKTGETAVMGSPLEEHINVIVDPGNSTTASPSDQDRIDVLADPGNSTAVMGDEHIDASIDLGNTTATMGLPPDVIDF